MTISGIASQTTGPIAVPEEVQEIRTATTEEGAAKAQPMKEAEQSRGLGTLIDTRA